MNSTPLPQYPANRESEALGQRRVFISLLVRTVVAAAAAAVSLSAGLPVLGHSLRIEWLVLAVAIIAVSVPGVRSRWGLTLGWQKLVVAGSGIAIALFFVGGLVSDPVVIRGQVQAETSAKAKQSRFAEQLRTDLLALNGMDKFLKSSSAEAWSSTDQIKAAKAQAEGISQKYHDLIESDSLPSGEFGQASSDTTVAGYTMSKALELRLSLLKAGDEKLGKDVQQARSDFFTQLNSAGTALQQAVQQLGIPLIEQKGPTES